jgi:phosphoribosylaminoimidazolecarboxamide formyltransferase/IMP cyclohydrolase
LKKQLLRASESDIIEKIDIGGISLIRAAAKKLQDTVIIAQLTNIVYFRFDKIKMEQQLLQTEIWQQSFSCFFSHYDTAI